MKRFCIPVAIVAALVVGAMIGSPWQTGAQESTTEVSDPFHGDNFMYIADWAIAPGQIPNESIEEAKRYVRGLRATGELTSVRLFIHNTGPSFSVYIVLESPDWASIEAGWSSFLGVNPDILASPWKRGRHQDNIISEIVVE